MINPSLHINRVFRKQFKKYLRATFHENTMENIRNVMKNKDTCVIALIFFNESKGGNKKIIYGDKLCPLFSHRELCLH